MAIPRVARRSPDVSLKCVEFTLVVPAHHVEAYQCIFQALSLAASNSCNPVGPCGPMDHKLRAENDGKFSRHFSLSEHETQKTSFMHSNQGSLLSVPLALRAFGSDNPEPGSVPQELLLVIILLQNTTEYSQLWQNSQKLCFSGQSR